MEVGLTCCNLPSKPEKSGKTPANCVVISDGLVSYIHKHIKDLGLYVPNTKEEEGSYNMGASPPQKFKSSKEKPLLSFATTTGV